MNKTKLSWCSLGILYSILAFSGCTSSTQDAIDVGVVESEIISTETDKETIELKETEEVNKQFLTDEQIISHKEEDRTNILTVFNSCRCNDITTLSNKEYFDSIACGTDGLYITEMTNELIYWFSDGNEREIWHRLTLSNEVSSLEDYMQYISDYLSKYNIHLEEADDFLYFSNIFEKSTDTLYVTLAYDNNYLWIGMRDSEGIDSKIFKQLKGTDSP